MVDADLAEELEVLSGQHGVSRDSFTSVVIRIGLRAFHTQEGAEQELREQMAS
jgi:hypothetical protein